MQKLQRKRLASRLAQSPLAYIVLILLAGLFIWSAIGAYGKSRIAKKRVIGSEQELANLQEQKGKLSADLSNANTPFGQEKALREKFNVVKEGEKVIVIVDEEPPASQEAKKEESGFGRFFRRIFGR